MNETFLQAQGRFLNAAKRVGTITFQHQARATQQHALFFNKLADAANRQVALLTECATPAEFFGKASEANYETGRELAQLTRETLELHAELQGSLVSAMQDEWSATFDDKAA